MGARTAFADQLRPKTIVIKDRTLRNNYASVYAVSDVFDCLLDHVLSQFHSVHCLF